MRVINPDHRLIAHKLTYLRDKRTDSPTFRRLAEELMTLLAYEATRDVRVEPFEIETPVAPTTGIKLSNPKPLVVPILRAGLGMLEGMVRLLPSAEVGFLGMQRDEETLEAITYANRLPDDLSGRQVYVLDPMLATGGSMADAIRFLVDRGADDITAVTLLSAPEGIAHLQEALADVGALGHAGHRRHRRAAQRGRLHRAGPRRRGRPPLRPGPVGRASAPGRTAPTRRPACASSVTPATSATMLAEACAGHARCRRTDDAADQEDRDVARRRVPALRDPHLTHRGRQTSSGRRGTSSPTACRNVAAFFDSLIRGG